MIVISGALVVVAAVLLLLGFVTSNLTFIYAAIGLSVVSGLFLLFGILQPQPPQRTGRGSGRPRRDDGREGAPKRRRPPKSEGEGSQGQQDGESTQQSGGQVPAQSGTDGNTTGAAAAAAATGAAAAASQHGHGQEQQQDQHGSEGQGGSEDPFAGEPGVEEVPDEVAAAAESSGMQVNVVSGHPRYHLEHCSVVVGDPELEPLDIAEAKELGFTPCAVCAPDHHLGGQAAGSGAPGQGQPHEPSSNGHAPAGADSQQYGGQQQYAGQQYGGQQYGGPQNGGQPPAQAAPTAAFSAPQAQQGSPFATQQMPVQQPQQPQQQPQQAQQQAPFQQQPQQQQPQQQQPQQQQPQQAQQAPVQETQAPFQPAETVEAPPAAPAPAEPQQQQTQQQPVQQTVPQPAAPTGRAKSVVTVSGRSDYHRPECSMVQGQQQESLSRVAAIRQGYFACSTCKP